MKKRGFVWTMIVYNLDRKIRFDDKEVQEFLRSNSLRRSSFMVVNNCRGVINGENYGGTNREMFESKLKYILGGVAEIGEVTKGDSPTPINLVKTLKQKVYELLKFLSYQSSVP